MTLAGTAAADADVASLARQPLPMRGPGPSRPRAGAGLRPRVWGVLVEGTGHHRAEAETVGRRVTEPGWAGDGRLWRALRARDRWRLRSRHGRGRGSRDAGEPEHAGRSSLRGITGAAPRGSGAESPAPAGCIWPRPREPGVGRVGVHSGWRWGQQARPRGHGHAGRGCLHDVVLVGPADGGRLWPRRARTARRRKPATDGQTREPSHGDLDGKAAAGAGPALGG